ncbi:MAG: hypothetical protein COZ07_06105 [Candidatus Infernicultor aquiphilus]|uniref:Lantibiotic ABC transporter permease n=1 Tax=Candidatus Infernicultor aquiphilus TaxID=1805029 RepID=A0A1J5GHV7_9BACT|nr:hypothetical protein [bacterium]OIP69178.1 MAG: hypothetical protein AUK42_05570 [Candidatus Atribacteria bacterium CG2_30_33_13]PIU25914.1 MAG: hypothetical protein COT11_00195 [Candidatus Atribacteria bacterium CG08_land_8_20_14_0_20_33_29]PIW12509.1 MAG: hypothetical protein COW35_01055 [Candidatus Atribacteria bacterium CG17_big_fil_post_rev_8_21_14_2_50_34_11]PIX33734.1 MAG: hypothetical protein COZ58_06550 [Candidatus Atribacteria bacterium CG_4_8_14_3_um_filter_34_18]PIY32337.1 MAG: 
MKKSQLKSLSILNLLSFVSMVIVNYLVVTLPLNNKTTGALADQYPNLFVPVGLTFSIWGIIYLLLAIFIVYQLAYAFRKNTPDSSFLEKIGLLFFLSCLANFSWIFAWHFERVFLSFLIMLILLLSLIAIYQKLNIGRSAALKSEKYLVHLPFSVYLGWVTIATIANTTALLVNLNWNRWGLSEPFWTIVVIIIGLFISLMMLFYRKDIFYCLVVDWALLGILIKRLTVDMVRIQSIITIVYLGLVIISLGIIIQIIRKKVY